MTEVNAYDSAWKIPRRSPILANNEIHVWRANLELSSPHIEQLTALLSADEIFRANRFRFPQHRRKFIVARGILRQLLGNYLAIAPARVDLIYETRGKPLLAANDSALQFNISHSQEYALFGFTRQHSIGVDLEYQRSMPDCLKIARRFFSANEFNLLQNAAQHERTKLFFQLWTAKEAYLKAIGTGLSGSLASVEIAFDLHQKPYIKLEPQNNNLAWSLYLCTPAQSYLGAICVNTNLAELTSFFLALAISFFLNLFFKPNYAGDRLW